MVRCIRNFSLNGDFGSQSIGMRIQCVVRAFVIKVMLEV